MSRNRFHSICPYFAMFPESFVEKHLIWTKPGGVVLDPFSGRGTTLFESLLRGRVALAGDTNPVAVCVSRAKADPPRLSSVLDRISELQAEYARDGGHTDYDVVSPEEEFFQACFHRETFTQLLFLRHRLVWKTRRTDRLIAALTLGCLHGESHRTAWCLSNRMPRTISTKPQYSVRWWRERGHVAPHRDAFTVLRALAAYRYESPLPEGRGRVAQVDARRIEARFPEYAGRVDAVITSPPYLDTTDYQEDQWLRLWFLGGPPSPLMRDRKRGDDRHRGPATYWRFIEESWTGVGPLLRDGAHIVVRIGGRKVDPVKLGTQMIDSLRRGLNAKVRLAERSSSRIVNGQLKAFRPGAKGTQREYDFHFRVG